MCSKCFEDAKKAKQEAEAKKATETKSSDVVMADSSSSSSSSNDAKKEEPSPPQPVQENPTCCYKCGLRVGYTIIKCRCGYSFCGKHRYSDTHDCTFDYKRAQKDKLAEDLQKVEADKVKNRLV